MKLEEFDKLYNEGKLPRYLYMEKPNEFFLGNMLFTKEGFLKQCSNLAIIRIVNNKLKGDDRHKEFERVKKIMVESVELGTGKLNPRKDYVMTKYMGEEN